MLRFPLFLELWNHLWRPHHGDADPAVKIPLLLEDLWRLMTHTNHVTYRHQLILRSHFVAGKCSRFNICQKMEGGKYGQLMCNLHLEDKPCHSHISPRVHTRQQSMEFPATTAILHQKKVVKFSAYQQHHGSIHRLQVLTLMLNVFAIQNFCCLGSRTWNVVLKNDFKNGNIMIR